jgi:hypothetical protein
MTRNSRFLPPLLLGWAALVACSSSPFHGGDPQSAPEGGAAGDGGFVGAGSAPLAGGAGIGSSAGVGSNAGVGGAPGTAGSSGVTALAGASGSSSGEPCPVLAGEPMLRVGSYCIDKNEVTVSGNVAEWVDSCSGTNGTSDHCRLRGGSVMSTSDQLTCANVIATQRNLTSQTIGFRCCTL